MLALGVSKATTPTDDSLAAVPSRMSQQAQRRCAFVLAHLQPLPCRAQPAQTRLPATADARLLPGDWESFGDLAPRPIVEADGPTASGIIPELTPEEAEHFRENGWLIRRAFISAAELQPFVDQLWARAPTCLSRNNPASWVDVGQRWVNTPTDRRGHGSNLEVFSQDSRWWIGEIGHDSAFMHATCRHPRMLRMVESFLGGPVKLPTRNRGLYSVWPRFAPARQLGPHLDNQSEELLATTYLGPVNAADGGFTFWPGSHKSMWCASHEQINWVPNGTHDQRMAKIRAETQPLVFTGDIGDTLFW